MPRQVRNAKHKYSSPYADHCRLNDLCDGRLIQEKIIKLASQYSLEYEVEDVEEFLNIESEEHTNEQLVDLEERRRGGAIKEIY